MVKPAGVVRPTAGTSRRRPPASGAPGPGPGSTYSSSSSSLPLQKSSCQSGEGEVQCLVPACCNASLSALLLLISSRAGHSGSDMHGTESETGAAVRAGQACRCLPGPGAPLVDRQTDRPIARTPETTKRPARPPPLLPRRLGSVARRHVVGPAGGPDARREWRS